MAANGNGNGGAAAVAVCFDFDGTLGGCVVEHGGDGERPVLIGSLGEQRRNARWLLELALPIPTDSPSECLHAHVYPFPSPPPSSHHSSCCPPCVHPHMCTKTGDTETPAMEVAFWEAAPYIPGLPLGALAYALLCFDWCDVVYTCCACCESTTPSLCLASSS